MKGFMIMDVTQILMESPGCGYNGEKIAFYSVRCCWWTSFPDDLGSTANFGVPSEITVGDRKVKSSLPCCPYCGSMLMQGDLRKFIDNALENPEHYGNYGMEAFEKAHHRNSKRCFKAWDHYFMDNCFLPDN